MQDKTLTIDTLGDLDDGIVRQLVDTAITECLEDLDNRAMLNKARKVQISVSLEPVINDRAGLKGVKTSVEVQKKIPARSANSDYCPTVIKGSDVIAFLPDSRQDNLFTPAPEEVS